LKLLGQAGFLPELNGGLGSEFDSIELDFWSYAGEVLGADKTKTPVLAQ
jgi:hypothetical protein